MIRARRLHEYPNGDRLYHLDDGRQLRLSYHDLWLHSEDDLLRMHGVELSRERLPAMRRGARIGSLPRNFDWRSERLTSAFVDLRPGDFTLVKGPEGDYWEVTHTLTSGDLDAIPSFRRL